MAFNRFRRTNRQGGQNVVVPQMPSEGHVSVAGGRDINSIGFESRKVTGEAKPESDAIPLVRLLQNGPNERYGKDERVKALASLLRKAAGVGYVSSIKAIRRRIGSLTESDDAQIAVELMPDVYGNTALHTAARHAFVSTRLHGHGVLATGIALLEGVPEERLHEYVFAVNRDLRRPLDIARELGDKEFVAYLGEKEALARKAIAGLGGHSMKLPQGRLVVMTENGTHVIDNTSGFVAIPSDAISVRKEKKPFKATKQ
jgi:hypothetical protein